MNKFTLINKDSSRIKVFEPDNLKVISSAESFFKIEGKKCRFPYMW